MSGLCFLPISHLPDIQPQMDLAAVLKDAILASGLAIESGDIVAVTQKIVSKAEGSMVRLSDVLPSDEALRLAHQSRKDPRLVQVILNETKRLIRVRGDVLICETHHGFICANAGVDRSNVDGGDSVTLLPRDPGRSARRLAQALECGVIITDTFGRAWREGLLDLAIGTGYVPLFMDYRGKTDTHGYALEATNLAAIDGLAAAAGLVMGKTANTPAALIRGFRWERANDDIEDILRPTGKDLFL